MGIDYYAYCGPVVLVPKQLANVQKTLRKCLSCNRLYSDNDPAKYCPQCGFVIQELTVTGTEAVQWYQLCEELYGRKEPFTELCEYGKKLVLGANEIRDPPREFHINVRHDGQQAELLPPDAVIKEVAWLERRYLCELAALRAKVEGVEVTFGFFTWSG